MMIFTQTRQWVLKSPLWNLSHNFRYLSIYNYFLHFYKLKLSASFWKLIGRYNLLKYVKLPIFYETSWFLGPLQYLIIPQAHEAYWLCYTLILVLWFCTSAEKIWEQIWTMGNWYMQREKIQVVLNYSPKVHTIVIHRPPCIDLKEGKKQKN